MYNYNNYLNDDYFRNTMPNNTISNQTNLYNPKEGYEKGNLFTNLYSEYKNYKPKELKANNEQEALFLELSKYSFAAHELNLYLDLHPEDSSMLALFNDYRERTNNLINEYEKKYGPLTISSASMQNNFNWVNNSWPWVGGEV